MALVRGQASFEGCGAKARLRDMLRADVTVRHFSQFQRNPTVDDVQRGISWLREGQADVLLAIGGGSVLDMAKAINTLCTLPQSPREALLSGTMPQRAALPLIAVPTTAGTGAEVTRFAALYIDGIKHSLDHPCLLPDAALVDPSLACSSPPQLAACAGLDALCQAIESYWAVGGTIASREYAAEAIRELLPHLQQAVEQGTEQAYTPLSRGAWLAGRAIDISRTTAAHALSYPLTVHAGLAHGHAAALTLPYFMRINADRTSRQLQRGLEEEELEITLRKLWSLLGCGDANEAAEMLHALLRALGMPAKLPAPAISDGQVERMAREINLMRLGNNPVVISEQAVLEAYRGLR